MAVSRLFLRPIPNPPRGGQRANPYPVLPLQPLTHLSEAGVRGPGPGPGPGPGSRGPGPWARAGRPGPGPRARAPGATFKEIIFGNWPRGKHNVFLRHIIRHCSASLLLEACSKAAGATCATQTKLGNLSKLQGRGNLSKLQKDPRNHTGVNSPLGQPG